MTKGNNKATAPQQDSWRQLDREPDRQDSLEPITRKDSEWRDLLSADEFAVLRKEATERAFTHPLNEEKRPGIFVCAGCGLPLFSSEMKFDSGTGWPSFFTSIPGRLGEKRDFKLFLPRTEYHCARCGGHQGHVFPDGPEPTGLRYCNNGTALRFIPKEGGEPADGTSDAGTRG